MASSSTIDDAGFRDGASSVHTSRTMMLAELRTVLAATPVDAPPQRYREAIVADNVLGKATRTTRDRTARRLAELYVLDPANEPYRAFRARWDSDARNQPMLAFLLACWRDPLLRRVTASLLAVPAGHAHAKQRTIELLTHDFPHRFGEKTLTSTAQNLASSWTQAGFLEGKVNKRRARPHVAPAVASFALYLGYLRRGRGDLLLDSTWSRVLDRPRHEVIDLAVEASRQGWMRYKSAGSVVEITFPDHWQSAAKGAG